MSSVNDFIAAASAWLGAALTPQVVADLVKALIGTFIGAFVAFRYALRKDRLTHLREQKAAGALAVMTLVQQMNDFLHTKTVIEEYRKLAMQQQPDLPLWMQVKPMESLYRPHLRYELQSLVFLLEEKDGAAVLEKLMNVEMKYQGFFQQLETHAKVVEEIQRKFSDKGIDPYQEVKVKELADAAGFALTAKASSFVRGIFEHVTRSEDVYLDAAKALPELLVRRFGKDGVIKIVPPTKEALIELAKRDLPVG